MLPFTKRPGRGGEDGVFTKDDLDDLAATNEKAATAPPPSMRPVAKPDDFGDDEVTNFIPSKSVSAIVNEARSKPVTIPPPPASRRPPASVPPPPMSQRPGKFITHVGGADEDEDGRTVVRGAPKIVKKSSPPPSHSPASMSPAAVIKATLESARAAKRANEGALMPPPPAELLEDMTDRMSPDDPRIALASRIAAAPPNSVPPPPQSQRPQMMQGGMQSPYTAPMGMTPMGVSELGATMLAGMGPGGPPSSRGPMTGPPPPMHLAHGQAHGYPAAPPSASGSIPPPPQSYRPPNSYGPSASQSGGHAGVPAHFMVPNGPYSDGRMDPPGTSVTARHKVSGRPASAWAIALVAAGLFVGVGAVAVMQSNDSLMDTTASFVDPSRAAPKAGAPAAPAAEPAPQAAPTTAIAPAVNVPPAANPDPNAGGVIGASAPAAQPPVAAAPAAPAAPAAEPKPEAKPEAKPAAVAAAPVIPAAPKTTWIAPTPKAQAPVAAAPAPAPAPKPTAAPKVAANDDPPAEKPTKPVKGAKPGKGDATDDETKKALEALQKAQLESSFDK